MTITLKVEPTSQRELRFSAFASTRDNSLWLYVNSINHANPNIRPVKEEALIELKVNNYQLALEIAKAINAVTPATPPESLLQQRRSPEPQGATGRDC